MAAPLLGAAIFVCGNRQNGFGGFVGNVEKFFLVVPILTQREKSTILREMKRFHLRKITKGVLFL